jgi:hypothetical protein
MTLVFVLGQVLVVAEGIVQMSLEADWIYSSVQMRIVRFHLTRILSPHYPLIAMMKIPQMRVYSPFVEIGIALIYQ